MNHSEATIQAELYHQCRLIGLRVALELKTSVGRLDLVILSDRECVQAIVEVKKMKPFYETLQVRRYKTLGIPVFDLWRIEDCASMALTLAGVNGDGVPLSVINSQSFKLSEDHPLALPKRGSRKRLMKSLSQNRYFFG